MRRRWAWILALLAGCHDRTPVRVAVAGPARDRLPSLKLARVSTDVDASPLYLGSSFRIGPQGVIVMQYEAGDGLLLSEIDTAGKVVRRFGRIGDGPAELRGGGVADVSDSGILVGDTRHERLDRFDFDGRLLASSRVGEQVFPMAATSAQEILTLVERKDGDLPATVSVRDGVIHLLMDAPDSFVASFPATRMFANGSVMSVRKAVIGRWTNGFVLADGWDYRLALYDWNGRLRNILHRELPPPRLSPARLDHALRDELPFASRRTEFTSTDSDRLRSEIAARRVPFFPHTHAALGLDGQGRIWVLGVEGDSAFADVFNADRFLGRIGVPCANFDGAWSLSGAWLAMACAPDNPAFDGNAVFKVFRLID